MGQIFINLTGAVFSACLILVLADKELLPENEFSPGEGLPRYRRGWVWKDEPETTTTSQPPVQNKGWGWEVTAPPPTEPPGISKRWDSESRKLYSTKPPAPPGSWHPESTGQSETKPPALQGGWAGSVITLPPIQVPVIQKVSGWKQPSEYTFPEHPLRIGSGIQTTITQAPDVTLEGLDAPQGPPTQPLATQPPFTAESTEQPSILQGWGASRQPPITPPPPKDDGGWEAPEVPLTTPMSVSTGCVSKERPVPRKTPSVGWNPLKDTVIPEETVGTNVLSSRFENLKGKNGWGWHTHIVNTGSGPGRGGKGWGWEGQGRSGNSEVDVWAWRLEKSLDGHQNSQQGSGWEMEAKPMAKGWSSS